MRKNKFVIIIPFYNASKWIGKSIKSVMLQKYDNFSCVVADDCSTDNSYQICQELIGDDDKFTLIRTKKNLGPLGNAYEAATIHNTEREKENIIVILDGDDFFSSADTLSILNEHYNKHKCWMTYGSYINLSNKQVGKFSSQVPSHVVENNLYRQAPWCTSHLRSYKFGLLNKVQKADIIDQNGDYYKAAGDLALMFPLLEMSRERAHFVNDVLYIWNDLNELNEHKDKRQLQISCEQLIRSLEKYKRLEKL
jgi:glycosyltransferase involved in cell wall biosynthesis